MRSGIIGSSLLAVAVCFAAPVVSGAETFRVASYNVEGYMEAATASRAAKSAQSKAKVRESILALKPDVLALQEIGSAGALFELRDALKAEGLDLPNWELVGGSDTNIYVAILSKFPFAARRPHTNDNFLLSGRRFRVSRGFAEVEIRVTARYAFTLIAAHLKSRRTMAMADETELRLEEAKLLREKIDARLAADPNANLVVLGDFNDNKDSASTKAVIGKGKFKLVDTRPAERNGDDPRAWSAAQEPRTVSWTHYYARDDTYARIDFIMLSPGMAREWIPGDTYVLSLPNWGIASDHRPVVATFEASDN